MTIGEKIRELRTLKGLTQKELGQISDTAETTIRQYENNKRQAKIGQIEKIAKALEVSPTDIMGWGYFDKKLDVAKIREDVNFIEYLESVGYTFQNDMVATEWEENPDGSKYAVAYDESPNAPCCTLVKGEVTSIFTNQQFKDFQQSMVESAEFHAFRYHK